MRKLSLVQKQTKLTMNVTLDCKYQDSVCEFKIKQEFCSESEDSDELLNELIYFIKRNLFLLHFLSTLIELINFLMLSLRLTSWLTKRDEVARNGSLSLEL